MNRRELLKLGTATALSGVTVTFLRPVAFAQNAQGTAQVAAAQRFKVGDMIVTALSDGYLEIGASALSGVSEEDFQEALNAAFLKPGAYIASVNAFVVQAGSNTYMIDAGTGTALGPTVGQLTDNLNTAGFQPSSISKLFTTHLHPDHIGGCVKDGEPVFNNAEFVMTRDDRVFWTDAGKRSEAPEQMQAFFDLATSALKAYGDRLREISGETEVAPGITSVPLPGHTPGHTGYRLTSGNETMLVWADIVHVAPAQLPNPDVTIGFDIDPAQAAKTRKALLEQVAADRILIAGAHLPFPGIGHIEKAGAGYRFVPANWQYL
jgi:glyoxylase-like metal-dependent hydrolase (beta-lactamase superfamily II)